MWTKEKVLHSLMAKTAVICFPVKKCCVAIKQLLIISAGFHVSPEALAPRCSANMTGLPPNKARAAADRERREREDGPSGS